jgi:hypothetical protein
MPSHRSLSALFSIISSFISGLAVRLPALARHARALTANLRQSGLSRARRLPLGFAAAGLVAVIGVTAGPVSPASAATNLATISHIGPAIAAGHAGDALFAPEASEHPAAAQHRAAPAPRTPAPAKATPAKTTPATPAPRQAAPAKPAPRKAPAKARLAVKERKPAHRKPVHHAAKVAKPYTIYDSIHPSAFPAKKSVAIYATGNYAAQPSEVAGQKSVMWIDITGRDYAASVLDVEPGDATPAVAADWAQHRLSADSHALARIYTMRSEWGAVVSAVSHMRKSMRDRIRWWIADPTGVDHMVPGSSATQWYWGPNYDVTTANPNF